MFDLDTVDGLAESAFQGVHGGHKLPVFILIAEDGRKQQIIFTKMTLEESEFKVIDWKG